MILNVLESVVCAGANEKVNHFPGASPQVYFFQVISQMTIRVPAALENTRLGTLEVDDHLGWQRAVVQVRPAADRQTSALVRECLPAQRFEDERLGVVFASV